jgi:hypothetical protein
MKLRSIFLLSVVLLAQFLNASGQGFVNLDFEAANISEAQAFDFVQTSDSLPGWNVFYGTNSASTFIGYETLIVGAPQADLMGTNRSDIKRIEGNFSVFLQGGQTRDVSTGIISTTDATISQTGLVPTTAESIIFKAQPGTQTLFLSLGGQNIPFTDLATTADYTLFGGDVSAFADQSFELEFTMQGTGTGWNLDSIEFSSQPVPEPNVCGLVALGCLFFKLRRSN